uniref:Uncharacterized protein n=1 Tax=Anguilla anguilla TaxID=7936 RepID=A0A0E9RWA8_ANGAN
MLEYLRAPGPIYHKAFIVSVIRPEIFYNNLACSLIHTGCILSSVIQTSRNITCLLAAKYYLVNIQNMWSLCYYVDSLC